MATTFFGLDGEMSSADLSEGGRLIQIGVAAHTTSDGSEALNPEFFGAILSPGPNTWSLIAEGVHGFTEAEIAAATPAADVDLMLVDWLVAHGADPRRRGNSIPIGFNVGAFDMPHVALVLPRASALFSRRTVDLNAICFTLDGADYDGLARRWDGWKDLASTYAARMIASLIPDATTQAHDAGYDALLHLHAWRFLRAYTRGSALPMPLNVVPKPQSQTQASTVIQACGMAGAVELTGIPAEFLGQWAKGGRAANRVYLDGLDQTFDDLMKEYPDFVSRA